MTGLKEIYPVVIVGKQTKWLNKNYGLDTRLSIFLGHFSHVLDPFSKAQQMFSQNSSAFTTYINNYKKMREACNLICIVNKSLIIFYKG